MSDDAKPMTTADVEDMPKHTDNPHTYVAEYPNHVLVRRDELLATTRALDTALREIDCGQDVVCGSPPGCVRHWEERNRELVRERDEARAEVTRRDALIARDGYEDMRKHAVDLAQRLEKAEKELIGVHKVLIDVHDALHRECDGTANLPDEIRALRAERDAARADEASAIKKLAGLVVRELRRSRRPG